MANLDGHADQARIILAIAEDASIKDKVVKEIERHLKNKYTIYHFKYIRQPDWISLPRFCRSIQGELPVCVFASGLEDLKKIDYKRYNDAILFLNNHREDILLTRSSVILWAPPHVYADLSEQALDFMDWRTTLAEFSLSEETADLLKQHRHYEEMLARPNLNPALTENFKKETQSIRQRFRDIRATAGDADYQYDVFLNYAVDDLTFAENLAKRLRDEGVNVWFDRWEPSGSPSDERAARPYHHLEKSRKMLVLWSRSYFLDKELSNREDIFEKQHQSLLTRERILIPILLDDSELPATKDILIHIDFRVKEDFGLKFRQLLEALDLFHDKKSSIKKSTSPENFLNQPYEKDIQFQNDVAKIYRLLGFNVKNIVSTGGENIDFIVEQKIGGINVRAAVKCSGRRITSNECNQILTSSNAIREKHPAWRWIAVSAKGFAPDARDALEKTGVSCLTYSELLGALAPLDRYVESIISKYEKWARNKWNGRDCFIRPELETDIAYEKHPALSYFGKWLGDDRSNSLIISGDFGTGKTTLIEFLSYHLALAFRNDPLRHPAPVLIPLLDVKKEISLEGIVIRHFTDHGLPDISFSRFNHLLRLGKIILFFDAFDEMANDRQWETMKSNFAELSRAAKDRGKVVFTCRTDCFKDRNERIKFIEKGASFEMDTEIYREFKKRPGAEVVYLQEFDDVRIQVYLKKVRPESYEKDWRLIQKIHNLTELAHRPLLLDMIVDSLPELEKQPGVAAADLHEKFTNMWIEREESRGRVLNEDAKRDFMLNLSW